MHTGPERFTLRSLPLAARLVLALFLVAVGLGYGTAMVQVHFQHASPGQVMPSTGEMVRKFHGDPALKVSALERLVEADEALPFNGTGTMATAFTKRSDGWSSALRAKKKEMPEATAEAAEAELRREREGERQAVLWWIKDGLKRPAYDGDSLPLPVSLAGQPFTAEFKNEDGSVKLKSLFIARCQRCHQKDGDDANAVAYPLETYEQIQAYCKVEANAGAMSVTKLAQTTHAHLLSFAVLFTLTGLITALSSYPGWLRATLAPLVLGVQVLDIACWWLARLDGPTGELFAHLILYTGVVVGGGLFLQIVLGLFDLFGTAGKMVLLVLFVGAGVSAGVLKQQVIDPQLRHELEAKAAAAAPANKPAENGGK